MFVGNFLLGQSTSWHFQATKKAAQLASHTTMLCFLRFCLTFGILSAQKKARPDWANVDLGFLLSKWCFDVTLPKVCSYGEEEGRAAFINSTPSLCFKGCYAPLTLKTTTTAASGGFHETFACFGTSTTVEERLLNEKSVVGKRRHTSFTSNHDRNNKQLSKKVKRTTEKEWQVPKECWLNALDK